MTKSKFLFKIYYIGKKKYYGSQRQLNHLTIEQSILSALKNRGYIDEVCNSQFEFASRTDKYVSARGACFTCIPKKNPVLMEINSALPDEIGIWAYTKVPLEFSSRYNALLRYYIYIVPEPFSLLQQTSNMNIELMKRACKQLEGRHDFFNFSKSGAKKVNTVRDMDSVILSIKNDYLMFHFQSRAFLRQQIRRIIKKLLDLGKGIIIYEEFLKLFDPSRKISYQPANPEGLILWDIKYNDNIEFIEDFKSKRRMNTFFLEEKIKFGLKYSLFKVMQQDNFGY